MRSRTNVAFITVTSMLACPVASASPVLGAATYVVALTGAAEAVGEPVPISLGDRDGSGSVRLVVDLASKQVCYEFRLSKVATPLMAHIHRAPPHQTGPSVVTLFTGPGGELNDCLAWTEERLAEIVSEPTNFYVNLYTTEHPEGALRGQLHA